MIFRKASIIISIRSYIEQAFTSLQINRTFSQEQQFTPMWKAVHTTPFLHFTIDDLRTMY